MRQDLIIAEQPDKKDVIKLIANMLNRLASLYQIQGWSENRAADLAFWVYDNYKYDSIEDVIECFANPPENQERDYRLTPDTIREWMSTRLEQTASKRENHQAHYQPEKETHNQPMPNVDKLLNKFLAELKESKIADVPKLTKKEIREEGQSTPPIKKATASAQFLTTPEQAELKSLKIEWARIYTDLYTGKVKEGAPTFEQFVESKKV